jgi:hypothetical protein
MAKFKGGDRVVCVRFEDRIAPGTMGTVTEMGNDSTWLIVSWDGFSKGHSGLNGVPGDFSQWSVMTCNIALASDRVDDYTRGWNDCRAAMLKLLEGM